MRGSETLLGGKDNGWKSSQIRTSWVRGSIRFSFLPSWLRCLACGLSASRLHANALWVHLHDILPSWTDPVSSSRTWDAAISHVGNKHGDEKKCCRGARPGRWCGQVAFREDRNSSIHYLVDQQILKDHVFKQEDLQAPLPVHWHRFAKSQDVETARISLNQIDQIKLD